MNFNFELINYFNSKLFNATHLKLFFDWESKGYFYRQEPVYFFKDVYIFIKYFFIKLFKYLSKSQQDIDLKAAREAIFYRAAVLKTNKSQDHDEMDKDQLAYEIDRLNTREK